MSQIIPGGSYPSKKRSRISFEGAGSAAGVIGRMARSYLMRKTLKSAGKLANRVRNSRETTTTVGRIQSLGTGGQCTYFKLKNKDFMNKSLSSTLETNRHTFSASTQILVNAGLQKAAGIAVIGGTSAMASIFSDYALTSASKIVVNRITGDFTLNNVKLSNVTIDIYDCICRNATPAATQDATAAWVQASTDAGITGEETKPGSLPWAGDTFNFAWKVMQKTRVVLGAGEMHRHIFDLQLHKQFTWSEFTYNKAYKNFTYSPIFVVKGAPANDSTTTTSVTLGTAGINAVYTAEYDTTYLQDRTNTVYDHSGLATSFAVTEAVLNEGGSTITTNSLIG